jgi:hypothetical protein
MPAADSFFTFLAQSMRILEQEAPERYASLSLAMGDMQAQLTTNGSARIVRFDGSRFVLEREDIKADVDVEFTSDTILDLVDGELSLEEAIDSEVLWIRGAVEVVEHFYDAVLIYIDGAMRSPGFLNLLKEFRRQQDG